MQVEIRVDDARTNQQVRTAGKTEMWDVVCKTKYLPPSSDQQMSSVCRTRNKDRYNLLFMLDKHGIPHDMRTLSRINDRKVYGRVQIKGKTEANPGRDAGQAEHLYYHLMCCLSKAFIEQPMTNYVDIGGGDGGITRALGDKIGAKNILVCDPKYTVGNQVAGVGVCADLATLADNSQDFATCIFSMHHFADLVSMLTHIARIVKPQGLLFIKEHDCWNAIDAMMVDIEHGLFMTANSEIINDHHTLHFKNHAGWARTLLSVGFEQVHYTYFCGPRNDMTPTRAYCALFRRVNK